MTLVKVLFASMPGDGHFDPLTPVAAHLEALGHDVRWYAGPRYAEKVERLGMKVFPYDRATEVTGENLNELFPERARLKSPPRQISFDLDKFFVSNVENHFLDIVDIRERFDFDIFFCDGAVYAEKLVAERLGVPVFAVGLPTVIPGPGSPPPFLGMRPARTIVGKAVHALGRKMIAGTMKRGVQEYNEVLAANGLDPIPPDGFPHAPMSAARRVFLNGAPGLEFPGYRPPDNAEFVGHLRPVRPSSQSVSVPAAATESGATVVAVSQGTVDNTDPHKLIGPTLEALRDSELVVVATTGGAGTDELRRRFAAPNIVVEDFVDFDRLFPHVDVFVTNGGYGSILTALHHGVPVIGAGKREGKNDNNARIAYRGLGVDLRSEHPRPAKIGAAVRSVIGDAAIRENVNRLRDELDSYDPLAIIDKALREAVPV